MAPFKPTQYLKLLVPPYRRWHLLRLLQKLFIRLRPDPVSPYAHIFHFCHINRRREKCIRCETLHPTGCSVYGIQLSGLTYRGHYHITIRPFKKPFVFKSLSSCPFLKQPRQNIHDARSALSAFHEPKIILFAMIARCMTPGSGKNHHPQKEGASYQPPKRRG